ncbi:hypothetical protein [Chamaesiphon minutus]|nr:hypothetical protein [Chamaesiphon minutus]
MQAKKLPHLICGQLTVSIAIVLTLQACAVNKRGAPTPDRVVEQYLSALETKKEHLMLDLIPENFNLTKEVRTKIDKIGGRKIQDRQIVYTKPKSSLWNAKIKGFYLDSSGNKQKFEDSIVLEYQNKGDLKLYAGRWYLLLEDRE